MKILKNRKRQLIFKTSCFMVFTLLISMISCTHVLAKDTSSLHHYKESGTVELSSPDGNHPSPTMKCGSAMAAKNCGVGHDLRAGCLHCDSGMPHMLKSVGHDLTPLLNYYDPLFRTSMAGAKKILPTSNPFIYKTQPTHLINEVFIIWYLFSTLFSFNHLMESSVPIF